MEQFRWRKGTIVEGMGRRFWVFVRRLKIMKRILQVCLIMMMLPGFLWAGNESSRRADRLSSLGIYAYVAAMGAGLRVIDVSDPANPTEVGFCDTWEARDVYVSGNYAYVADSESGLRIIDISDPTNPFEVGFYDPPPPAFAVGVYISGNYAYVAFWGYGLRIVDVSDPTNPFEVSYFDSTYCNDVYVSGNYAYAMVADGFCIIDVSDPTNPDSVGVYDPWPYTVEDCVVSGRYAYLAHWAMVKQEKSDLPDIFEIIDVS
ncbi:hypothetical protein KAX29_04495, partial [candidate division WOR-3 bacterium]|nr:hypothetical protein [candidate division WOR-3 bacterium]